jgi:pantothenate synthetase
MQQRLAELGTLQKKVRLLFSDNEILKHKVSSDSTRNLQQLRQEKREKVKLREEVLRLQDELKAKDKLVRILLAPHADHARLRDNNNIYSIAY